ncbi:MAG: anti-sigma factor family protein [Pyrinomonadaceae bacterium]
MNCDKCQELLSDFIDGTLTGEDRILFDSHLVDCLSCVGVREEMRSIVGVARETREHYAAPPNERAMWLRIRKTIEVELDTNRPAKAAANSARDSSTEGFWSPFRFRGHCD